MYDKLLTSILRRNRSMFTNDIHNNDQQLKASINNARILIIGAAGSIGGAFVKQVLKHSPASLHLIDLSENNLVELVRDLRSSKVRIPKEFRTFAIALGSLEFNTFIKTEFNYDHVVNFAAMKHVRSERDPYTLMRLFDTNVFYVKGLLEELSKHKIKKFFSVSSDKAVAPVSIMGATKVFMERTMLFYSEKVTCSSSRFANVAFSDGSLLYGFQQRLSKKQPLSFPHDVKRYFISLEEAGQLCLLSCFCGNNRDIYFPKLDRNLDLLSFVEITSIFLKNKGYQPKILPSEELAKEAAMAIDDSSKEWPCCFSESDTTGEKSYEEFYTDNDSVSFDKYQNIGIIHQPTLNKTQVAELSDSLESFYQIKRSRSWSKEEILNAIKIAVPEIQHEEKHKNLDQKM